ncbi:MAG: hypothetical protein CMF49_05390 [Legionellales bacterium]|nr:hypothetical protein [Legionellales bacterium]|tara:strand:+ start:636 stop:1166 length:531 start_codon:yes stop_codon:yes gene_type:complete
MKIFKHQKAIGLIEVMLVFAVVAVASIASIRYYSNAQAAQKINDTVNQYGEVKSAFENYLVDNNNNGGTGKTTVQVYTLVSDGYLPDSYGTTAAQTTKANPYGGGILLDVESGMLNIYFQGLPNAACGQIVNRLLSTMNTTLGENAVSVCSAESSPGQGGSDDSVNKNYVKATYVI